MRGAADGVAFRTAHEVVPTIIAKIVANMARDMSPPVLIESAIADSAFHSIRGCAEPIRARLESLQLQTPQS